MKICIAQTTPIRGDVSANIEAHKKLIGLALTLGTEAIFFPELSLTGYEPELAHALATSQNDSRLDVFQKISDKYKVIIGPGLPTRTESSIKISMILFEPGKPRQTYSKQQLHSDELPYFEEGKGQVLIQKGNIKIAPAICYESLQPVHAENAFKLGAGIYLASVAKSETGVEKAYEHYPKVAKQYSIPVLMSNCVGVCSNFSSSGKSAVWTKNGKLAGQLDDKNEGILFFNSETEETLNIYLT